jgi:signal transduction histidine kinase
MRSSAHRQSVRASLSGAPRSAGDGPPTRSSIRLFIMAQRTPSLRNILTVVTVSVTALALLVSGALILLTTYLHRASEAIGASVESIRLVQEAEVTLLLHTRASEPLRKRDIEGDLEGNLLGAGRYVTSEQEGRILEDAKARVEAYLSASREAERPASEVTTLLESAYGALETLVNINVVQSRIEEARAARWDRLGNVLGVGVVALLLPLIGGFLWWLRARAFRPIFTLAPVMAGLARGDRGARAEESGPAEVVEMARSFNELATAMAKQREAQMAFLAGIAHDLRNPLSVLKLSVSAIHPEKPLPPEPRIRRTLELINRQLTRLERMVSDFLDMFRIEAGKLELRFEQQDARDLVRGVVELFEATSPEHRLDLSMPDDSVPMRCDPLRIEQVVANLVSNAIKYSPGGGTVQISLGRERDEAVIAVTDQGIGMSEEDHPRLFEPFARVGVSKEAVPGMGLGLFVVRRIVEAHGGRIEVESSLGKGSTFRVFLPTIQIT